MQVIAFLLLFLLGRAASLGIYRMCWRNGVSEKYWAGSSILTLLRRPAPWIAHLGFTVPLIGVSWENFALLHEMSVVLVGLVALGAIGRFGAANLGRWFLMDRLVVLTLAVGVWFTPAFVYPSLVASCCLQYTVSSFRLGPGYSNLLGFEFIRASLCVVATSLALFGCSRIAGMEWDKFGGLALAVLLGFQASTYVNHALAKSALGPRWFSWIVENRIECLCANAWLRGWTLGRSRETVMKQVRWIARHRVALCGSVWILEMAWLIFLANERLAGGILLATILLHVAVFAMTGLACYQYVINHLVVLGIILFHDTSEVFQIHYVFAGLIAIPAAAAWIAWLRLRILSEGIAGAKCQLADAADHLMGWWDTPLMRMYSYAVETASGKNYALSVPKLSPHDTALTNIHTHLMILGAHSGFDPAIPHDRALARTGVWGLTIHREDRDFLLGLMGQRDAEKSLKPEALPAWEDLPEVAIPLREFFNGINRMLGKSWFRVILRWPHFPGEDHAPDICPLVESALPPFPFNEPIVAVTIVRVKTFLHRDGMTLIDHSVLGRIPLTTPES